MFKFDDVIIYWINASSNIKRSDHMKKLLDKYFPNNKVERIEAIMHSPKYHGVTLAHFISISKGILSNKPFLILEDDVNIDHTRLDKNSFENEINKLKEKPRVVYMGLSNWGSNYKNYHNIFGKSGEEGFRNDRKIILKNGAKMTVLPSDYFIKVENMYSAHAILYISKDYAKESLAVCIDAITKNKPHDIILPRLMKTNQVIGLSDPWFYQWVILGGQENGTRISIKNVKKI